MKFEGIFLNYCPFSLIFNLSGVELEIIALSSREPENRHRFGRLLSQDLHLFQDF